MVYPLAMAGSLIRILAMKNKTLDVCIGAALCLFSIWVYWYADRYSGRGINSYGPNFFPQALSFTLFLCSCLLIGRALAGFAISTYETTDRNGLIRAAASLLLATFYIIGMHFVGFLIATVAFLYGLMGLLGQKGRLTRIMVSLIVSGLIFSAFIFFLKIPLPDGVIFDSFRRY